MKNQKGFIQIPILIAIVVGIFAIGVAGYIGVRQYKIFQSEKIEKEKQAQKLVDEQQQALNQAQVELEKLQQESGTTTQNSPTTSKPKKEITAPVNSVVPPQTSDVKKPKTFTTPSGAVLDEFGNVISVPQITQTISQSVLTSTQISELVSPSVVLISTSEVSGSGFVVKEGEGLFIVTNAHVVKGSSVADIKTTDGRTFKGTVLGRDEVVDLAVLSTGGVSLKSVVLGGSGSNSLAVGDDLYALGFPFGLTTITFTKGTLSARQSIDGKDMLQTDTAINLGNSGGALVNGRAEVVGVNTLIIKPGLGSGIGFAIPIDTAKTLIPKLIQGLQNTIFSPPAIGGTVTIPRSMIIRVNLNQNLSCEALGYSGNDLTLCNLYKNNYNSYQWVVDESQ